MSTSRLDRAAVRKHFDVAAANGSEDVLAREVASRMHERLEYIRVDARRVLDLGCGAGQDLPLLKARFPQAECLALDFSLPMLRRVEKLRNEMENWRNRLTGRRSFMSIAADARRLPLADGCISVVWSNLLLPWEDDPLTVLKEAQRVLRTGGMIMFSTLGPDTLKELRAALLERGGERVHRFADMHDLGDLLMQAGFADPVMDMEMLTLTYSDLDGLLDDIRSAGAANAAQNRSRGLSSKQGWCEARADYENLRTEEGRLPATFEIVQGHAWKVAPKQTEDGRQIVSFHPSKRG